jgi:1-acyl-sn-glycerol-3-phosphate acyltransferase
MDALKSILIWACELLLLIIWFPLLIIRRLFDRDPALYYTGKFFRKLGKAASKVNPNWKVHLEGYEGINDRKPYVMVCNHLSLADIPAISNLPWEMKWAVKKELFSLPLFGWLLKLGGDIPVDQRGRQSISAFRKASFYLQHHCSVMFFPEGTRSRSGKLNRFARGAFELAIQEQVAVLPMVIDGTQDCLPKTSWVFRSQSNIKLKVLEPVSTENFTLDRVEELTERVRSLLLNQLSQWRSLPVDEIDRMAKQG